MWSRTSCREKSSTSWPRPRAGARPGTRKAQSGWARYRPLSSLTISGSTQMPNFKPSSLTRGARAPSPPGSFFSLTNQSPKSLFKII